MKSKSLLLILSLMLSGGGQGFSLECRAQGAAKPADAAAEAPLPNAALTSALAAYKAQPNDITWNDVIEQFKAYLTQLGAKMEPAAVLKANPDLPAIGTKVIAAGTASVWHWPQLTQNRIIVAWREAKAQPPIRRRPQPPIVTAKVQVMQLPPNVVLKDARVIDAIVAESAAKAPAPAEKKKPENAKFLVLAGNDRVTSNMWLSSYRLAGGVGWAQNTEPLSMIPPFLFQNLTGTIAFQGNDLMLTVKPKPGADGLTEQNSYKLALRLVEGHYALEGKAVEDTPYNAVYQFVQAATQGRLDLAKAWLFDNGPASVPKYVGLTNRAATATPLRIINMSGGAPGVYRFRLVTFDKNDLIFDVFKPKTQWAIKGIFIAPADPLFQKIARAMPSLQEKPAMPPDAAEPGKPADAGKVPVGKPGAK